MHPRERERQRVQVSVLFQRWYRWCLFPFVAVELLFFHTLPHLISQRFERDFYGEIFWEQYLCLGCIVLFYLHATCLACMLLCETF